MSQYLDKAKTESPSLQPEPDSKPLDAVSALARFKSHLEADEQTIKARQSSPLISDPWADLLKNLEARPNAGRHIVQAVDPDGKPEWRVRSCYLLTNVVGIAAERANGAHHRRLGAVMRKLGWAGPKNLRFGAEQAKGYFKAAEDVPRSNHTTSRQ
jgi:hypothetical protein